MSRSAPSLSSGENRSRAVSTSAPALASPAHDKSTPSSDPELSCREKGERRTATTNKPMPATKQNEPTHGELDGRGTEPKSEPPRTRSAPYERRSAARPIAPT